MIRSLFLFSCMLLFCCTAKSQQLTDFQWKQRIVLIQTVNFNEQDYRSQKQSFLSDIEGLKERDLLIFGIESGTYEMDSWLDNTQYDPSRIRNMVKTYFGTNVPGQILIGKDGTTKMHTSKPFTLKQLYDIIDQMPMRKTEASEKSDN